MSDFDKLLAQLTAAQEDQSALTKSVEAAGVDDKTIQAAAKEGGAQEEEEEEEEEPGGAPMTKSILIDGEQHEVVDADALIKSLGGMETRVTQFEDVLVKSLTGALAMIKGQGEMIKSLQGQITKIGGTGGGRKSALLVHERQPLGEQPLAKSLEQPQFTAADVMAKANAAFDAKKITGHELTQIDVSLRQGHIPDQALLTKALS